MRFALCFALLTLLLPASAHATGPQVKARLLACETSLEQEKRSATFAGDIKAVPGAQRLQVKFVLQSKQDGDGWTPVEATGFGTWNTSAPGIGRYVYTKTVENLPAPGNYRTQVHFRWLSGAGKTILRARRVSRTCRQPDLRPDLSPEQLEPLGDSYVLTIANNGRTDAGPFVITIEAGGRVQEFGRLAKLAAGEETRLFGQAPACQAGETLTVRADAEGAVDEADEETNELLVACPSRLRR
jgi:hypothetical protein